MSATVSSLGATGAGTDSVALSAATARSAPSVPPQRRTLTILLALLLGAGLVASQGIAAWAAWKREATDAPPPVVPVGALCSVQLVNGQVYYGELVDAGPRYAGLRNVYYVQTVAAANGAAPGNRLVSRRKGDWHAPTVMTVPIDKVLMIEAVGTDSRLAELIRQDQGSTPR